MFHIYAGNKIECKSTGCPFCDYHSPSSLDMPKEEKNQPDAFRKIHPKPIRAILKAICFVFGHKMIEITYMRDDYGDMDGIDFCTRCQNYL